MTLDSRNTIWGFATRVEKNLDFLITARATNGVDVHIVTHLITSLLGLIVFPYEELQRINPDAFTSYSLESLAADGWPSWAFFLGNSDTLDDLLRHVRNAISHGRLRYSSESRELHDVQIEFRDRRNKDSPDNWGASIRGDHLHAFVKKLADLLRTVQQTSS